AQPSGRTHPRRSDPARAAAAAEPRRHRHLGAERMSVDTEGLFELLPAHYRVRDRERGSALEALLNVANDQLDRLERDIERLYDNWFIETCDEWVVSYLGDLLGVRGLTPAANGTFTQRGLVANTIAHRRAKGTAALLEQLARDVTG